jgi:hypothetical protein
MDIEKPVRAKGPRTSNPFGVTLEGTSSAINVPEGLTQRTYPWFRPTRSVERDDRYKFVTDYDATKDTYVPGKSMRRYKQEDIQQIRADLRNTFPKLAADHFNKEYKDIPQADLLEFYESLIPNPLDRNYDEYGMRSLVNLIAQRKHGIRHDPRYAVWETAEQDLLKKQKSSNPQIAKKYAKHKLVRKDLDNDPETLDNILYMNEYDEILAIDGYFLTNGGKDRFKKFFMTVFPDARDRAAFEKKSDWLHKLLTKKWWSMDPTEQHKYNDNWLIFATQYINDHPKIFDRPLYPEIRKYVTEVLENEHEILTSEEKPYYRIAYNNVCKYLNDRYKKNKAAFQTAKDTEELQRQVETIYKEEFDDVVADQNKYFPTYRKFKGLPYMGDLIGTAYKKNPYAPNEMSVAEEPFYKYIIGLNKQPTSSKGSSGLQSSGVSLEDIKDEEKNIGGV